MNAPDPRCGTPAGYDAHRRRPEKACQPCLDAVAEYEYRRRIDSILGLPPRILSSVGTARRVQALVALGYTFGQIGDALNRSHDWAPKLAHQRGHTVRADTAALIDDLYRRWCMTPPPETTRREKWSASYARTIAKKNGWVPPLAWDDIDDPAAVPAVDVPSEATVDEVVVERLLAGRRIPSTPAEKTEAMRRWLAAGGSQRSLCNIHGWQHGRYVVRDNDEAGAA